jgi:hypothetical protein
MHELPRHAETESRRLLRILLIRLGEMPPDPDAKVLLRLINGK